MKGYRPWVRAAIPEAIQRGQLTGSYRLTDEVARKIGRRVERRGRGRPRKNKSVPFFFFPSYA